MRPFIVSITIKDVESGRGYTFESLRITAKTPASAIRKAAAMVTAEWP